MRINWLSYYMQYDGYGRFSSRMAHALAQCGLDVKIATLTHYEMPPWMRAQDGFSDSDLTISFLPPYLLSKLPGRQWLFSMTEGSCIPQDWVKTIHDSGVERVLVPCLHNLHSFRDSGVTVPISVVPGGTDPEEYPPPFRFYEGSYDRVYPYTFLTLADRGFRKGWQEVVDAFYIAFGGKTTGRQDVRLIIKTRSKKFSPLLEMMRDAEAADKRFIYQTESIDDMLSLYKQVDCLVMPSRSEGWGMPHREAAMCGLPVITQRYAGLDDGFTDMWSLTVENGEMQTIPKDVGVALGEWKVADIGELAEHMRWCANHPQEAAHFGMRARNFLRTNQTWRHSAKALLGLLEEHNGERTVYRMEPESLPLVV